MAQIAEAANEYKPNTIVFRTSYKCNLKCKHCYNSSVESDKTVISKDVALRVLSEARECGFVGVSLTGGEPMLFRDLVYSALRRASELGYTDISMVTNGYWGKSREKADEVLRDLQEVGFVPPRARLSISAGQFHREYLDWSYHRNIVHAYYELHKKSIRIDFEHAPGNVGLVDEFKSCLEREGIQEHWYRLSVRSEIASVGRWKEFQNIAPAQKAISSYGYCRPAKMFVVQPDGDVVPCCGYNRFNKGVVIGNVIHSSVKQILENATQNIALRCLYGMPLRTIHSKLSNCFSLPTLFTGICEVCEQLFDPDDHRAYLEGSVST